MHSPEIYRARWLRDNMTKTERRVGSRLRGRQVDGFKFRRQVSVGPYVIDFACVSERLAIEIDGPGHEDDSDERKNDYLKSKGYSYSVHRFPVRAVDESLDDVIHAIYLDLTDSTFGRESPHPAAPATRAEPTSPLRGEANSPLRGEAS